MSKQTIDEVQTLDNIIGDAIYRRRESGMTKAVYAVLSENRKMADRVFKLWSNDLLINYECRVTSRGIGYTLIASRTDFEIDFVFVSLTEGKSQIDSRVRGMDFTGVVSLEKADRSPNFGYAADLVKTRVRERSQRSQTEK